MTCKTCKWFSASEDVIDIGAALPESYAFNRPFEYHTCHSPDLDRDIDPQLCDYIPNMNQCKAYSPRNNQELLQFSRIYSAQNNDIELGQIQLWKCEIGLGYPGYLLMIITNPVAQNDPSGEEIFEDFIHPFYDKDSEEAEILANAAHETLLDVFVTEPSVDVKALDGMGIADVVASPDKPTALTYLERLTA